MKNYITLIIISLLTLNSFSQTKGTIKFDKETHNFGTIYEEKGSVFYAFAFTNTGKVPVTIMNVKPSCGCTTPDWPKTPIAPGQKGIIKTEFSPKNRPGDFEKYITVLTNGDPESIKLYITGKVIPAKEDINVTYPIAMGALRLNTNKIDFGNITLPTLPKKSINIVNNSDKDITISFKDITEYLSIKVYPEILKPNEKGIISIQYITSKLKKVGAYNNLITLLVNSNPASAKIEIKANILKAQ